MKSRSYCSTATATAAAVLAFCANDADAQNVTQTADNRSTGIAEIIVTARKRDENLQRIGQSVSALTGDQLSQRGIGHLEALQLQVPNFTMGQQLGSARISLRGVGLDNISASADGSIAFHSDGVYVARPAAALSTFFDVERVEVLRGPQGTLYGRNATGGSVNLISRKPAHTLSGYASATAANYDTYMFEGALSGPLVKDQVFGRLSVQTVDRGGFGENIVTGNEIDDATTRGVRGQVQFVPSASVSILLRAEYFEADDHNYGYHFINPYYDDDGFSFPPLAPRLGGIFPDDSRNLANDTDPQNDRDIRSFSAVISTAFGKFRFHSITGYQQTNYLTQSDLDASSAPLAPLYQCEDADQFSQELQLTHDAESWNWLLGAYYFQEKIDAFFDVPFRSDVFGGMPTYMTEGYYAGGRIDTAAYALFGELTRKISERVTLTLGARYSYEEKAGKDRTRFDVITPDVPNPGQLAPAVLAAPRDNFSALTPKLLLEYEATDGLLVYASASRGFKSGAINLGGLQDVVRPETVTAFEAGMKSDPSHVRWRANVAGFYYDYKDLQVGLVRSNVLVLDNAATASIYGLEAEFAATPVEHVRFDLVASYLHAEYEDFITQDQARPDRGNAIDPTTGQAAFQLAGNRLSQAPEVSINVGAQYEWTTAMGDFSLRGEIFWVDDYYFTPFNLTSSMQRAHSRQNAFIHWRAPNGHLSGQLFVRNIDGDDDLSHVFVASTLVGSPILGAYQEPRTFGVKLTYTY